MGYYNVEWLNRNYVRSLPIRCLGCGEVEHKAKIRCLPSTLRPTGTLSCIYVAGQPGIQAC